MFLNSGYKLLALRSMLLTYQNSSDEVYFTVCRAFAHNAVRVYYFRV